jgi:Cysteine rich repeat
MSRHSLLLGIAVMLYGQNAFAENRLTDPTKVARECKSEAELLCKGVRPGGQRMVNCLKRNRAELSTARSVALRSAETF